MLISPLDPTLYVVMTYPCEALTLFITLIVSLLDRYLHSSHTIGWRHPSRCYQCGDLSPHRRRDTHERLRRLLCRVLHRRPTPALTLSLTHTLTLTLSRDLGRHFYPDP